MSPGDALPKRIAGDIVGQSPLQVWVLTSQRRLQRQLQRAGADAPVATADRVVLLRADWVYDEALVSR